MTEGPRVISPARAIPPELAPMPDYQIPYAYIITDPTIPIPIPIPDPPDAEPVTPADDDFTDSIFTPSAPSHPSDPASFDDESGAE
jgi:hypothetical protein